MTPEDKLRKTIEKQTETTKHNVGRGMSQPVTDVAVAAMKQRSDEMAIIAKDIEIHHGNIQSRYIHLSELAGNLKGLIAEINNLNHEFITNLRNLRMATVTEAKQVTTGLNELGEAIDTINKLVGSKKTIEIVNELRTYLGICTWFKDLKEKGLIDALAKLELPKVELTKKQTGEHTIDE